MPEERIIEIEALGPAPFAAMMLADLGASEKHCPRCKSRQLIVFRNGRHVATVAYGGRNEGALRTSLQRARLLPAEVELLVQVARAMAEP